MKKKFQDWLRKQVGCPKCEARASGPTFGGNTFATTASNTWTELRYIPKRTV